MNVPSLPSNNLYAFCCVLGLALVVFAVVVPFEKANQYKQKDLETLRDIGLLSVDHRRLGELIDSFSRDMKVIKSVTVELSEEDQKKVRANKEIMTRVRSELARLAVEKEEIDAVFFDGDKKLVHINYQNEIANWYQDRYSYYKWIAWMNVVVGAALFLFGFFKWLPLQRNHDRLLQRQLNDEQ